LRRSSSLLRRVFVHGLVLPFRLGSRHSRGLSSLPHASARVVPLARLQGCAQKTRLATALRSVERRIKRPENEFIHNGCFIVDDKGMLLYRSDSHLVFSEGLT